MFSVGSFALLSGCLESCNSGQISLRLHPVDENSAQGDALQFDQTKLTEQKLDILDTAREEEVKRCTDNDIEPFRDIVERIAEYTGLGDDLYGTNGTTRATVNYRGEFFSAELTHDTGE
jgi:hypothetical protein